MQLRFLSILLIALTSSNYTTLAYATSTSEHNVARPIQLMPVAELDSLLAPIALYPDSILAHVFIASTYPLQVIEAHRWQQTNQTLSHTAVSDLLADQSWDPSIKALVPFPTILPRMSNNLDWLKSLGDAVLTNENQVLERVQALRSQAWRHGNLDTNEYQHVSVQNKIIVIEPNQPRVVYVPYYNPLIVFGQWQHPIAPIVWPGYINATLHRGFYWGNHVSLRADFYFGHIFWPERYLSVRRTIVHRYPSRPHHQHYQPHEYHRWQHRSVARQARYSQRVAEYKPTMVSQHKPSLGYRQAQSGRQYTAAPQVIKQMEKKHQQRPHVLPHSSPVTRQKQQVGKVTQHAPVPTVKRSSHSTTRAVLAHPTKPHEQKQMRQKQLKSTRNSAQLPIASRPSPKPKLSSRAYHNHPVESRTAARR